jgi:uncharacterized protein with PIN domain
MTTANFRFYAELNDFLAPARRGRESAARCARDASVKHMIEALGVPHTEVALILVNGEPAGFDRPLIEGDRVAVYPAFAVLDPGFAPLRPPPQQLFVADAHLGGLARLLRMAGFDTLYRNDYRDDELAGLAAEGERVLLTRDRELLKRREIVHGCYVHALAPAAQFREIVERLGLRARLRPFTRCLACNAPLRAADKAAVAALLPPAVRAHQERFTVCDRCGRVYWPGSHWRRMQAMLAGALTARAEGGRIDGEGILSIEEEMP